MHILDAFLNLIGPFARVRGQLVVHKPPPMPRDVASLMIEFANGVSGSFSTVRASPLYWRVHVFGDKASAESIGEYELLMHRHEQPPERLTFEPVNALKAELEAFVDAIEGRAPFPVSDADMLATVGTFEALVQALESAQTVTLT